VNGGGPRGFDRCAARYDEQRPVDANWWEVFERLVALGQVRGRRVLELGCGTGRLSQALQEREHARVFALDASPAMVEQARAREVNARLGRAEALPFKPGWFDAVVMRMVLHLLDRRRALAEAARVLAPDGRVVIASEDPASFERVWFARYFPSVPELDRGRFPSGEALAAELAAAGLPAVTIETLSQERTISRAQALDLIESKAYSTFELLDPVEYAGGLDRARVELPEELHYRFDWLLAVAAR
jgi:SAM-dependent methyltransferase